MGTPGVALALDGTALAAHTREGLRIPMRRRIPFRRAVLAAALASCLAALPATARAQYFGQNKVQYSSFEFEVIATEHFDVHFYPREREAALDAARMAERSYARLSRLLNHEFKERKPIILYASQSDFAQTNAVGLDFDPGDATGG